jgi:hypothetical protein
MSTGNTPPEQPNYEVDLTAWVSMAVGEMNRNMPSPISRAIMPFARLSQLVRERDAAVRREEREACAREKNDAYAQRNRLAILLASEHGGTLVPAIPSEPGWTRVLLIPLCTGQISFHLHDSEVRSVLECPSIRQAGGWWDGHTDEEKWSRVRAAAIRAMSNVCTGCNSTPCVCDQLKEVTK